MNHKRSQAQVKHAKEVSARSYEYPTGPQTHRTLKQKESRTFAPLRAKLPELPGKTPTLATNQAIKRVPANIAKEATQLKSSQIANLPQALKLFDDNQTRKLAAISQQQNKLLSLHTLLGAAILGNHMQKATNLAVKMFYAARLLP